jgi:uncharacterized membrane protein YhhN
MTALPPPARTIWLIAAVAAALYCALLGLRPYPGDVALKTAMCVLLAVLDWRAQFRLFAVALLFSAAGDALLGTNGERWFVPGLAAFLTTHLLYATIFWRDSRLPRTSLRGGRKVAAVAIPLFAIVYAAFLFPLLGALAVPVVGYIAAIVAMAVIALRVAAVSVPIGAVMFMVSDSLLAFDKFVWSEAWMGPLIWITYAAAQLLIAYGIVGRKAAGG